jgi:hypothetical protein
MKNRTPILIVLAMVAGTSLLLSAHAEPTSTAPLSYGVPDVVKLYSSGVDKEVIVSYVENSKVAYQLNANDIIQLHELGMPSDVVAVMIRHGAQVLQQGIDASLQYQQEAAAQSQAADAAAANTYAAPTAAPAPQSSVSVTYIGGNPGNGFYSYPAYYPSYYPYAYSYYSYPRYYRGSFGSYRHFSPHNQARGFGRSSGFSAHVRF